MRPLPAERDEPLWREARRWDRLEVWRNDLPRRDRGYAYAYEVRHDRAVAALQAVCPPNAGGRAARVLEIGGAGGNFTLLLAEAGYEVLWNDLRAELIPLVQAKHERGEVRFLAKNLFALTPQDVGPLDAILATEVIEHCAHPDAFLAHLSSLLRPGGVLVLTTPLGSYLRNRLPRFSDWPNPEVFEDRQFLPDADGHIFLLHMDEMARLAAAAGFVVERLETQVTPLTNGHMKLGLLLGLLPKRLVMAVERWSWRWPPALRRKLHISMLAVLRKA